jgi:putative PIN family toxin of toxin-antitoxin system
MSSVKPLPRAVVDTNLVVSGVVVKRGHPLALFQQWQQGRFRLLLSSPLRNEYANVLYRPKLLTAHGVARDDIDAFLRLVDTDSEFVTPAVTLPVVVRDPKDEPVLAAALGGNADFLVTGDDDLLALAGDPRLGRLRIVTVVVFLPLVVL